MNAPILGDELQGIVLRIMLGPRGGQTELDPSEGTVAGAGTSERGAHDGPRERHGPGA